MGEILGKELIEVDGGMVLVLQGFTKIHMVAQAK